MTTWDPGRYLQFRDERGRPFADLVARVPGDASSVLDLGCGPGQLTRVLRNRWPQAFVLGVDSSPQMVDRARSDNEDAHADYEQADVRTWNPGRTFDVVVSNAMFQWVDDPWDAIDRLLPAAPVWAVQVPDNAHEPSHRLLAELAATDPWADLLAGARRLAPQPAEAYLEFFASRGWTVDAWSTTYLHVLTGPDPVFAWVSGTGARPFLLALPPDLREQFAQRYRAALRDAYPEREWGTVLPFRRSFVVARRPSAHLE